MNMEATESSACTVAARLLAAAGWLPHAAESVHVSLRIERDDRRERRIRTFGDRVLASTHWAEGGLRHFVPAAEGLERPEGDRGFVNVRIGTSFAYTGLIKPRSSEVHDGHLRENDHSLAP